MKKKIVSGIMVTMFLVTMVAFAVPVRVSAAFTGEDVHIGIIGPKGWIQWDGIKEGAQMAADLINTAGGMISSDGKTHKVVLVEIDEHCVPIADPTAAVAELLTALSTHEDMQILIGGFQGETCYPIREAAMDFAAAQTPHRPIWIICGASDDSLIDCAGGITDPFTGKVTPFCGACVRCDYERYKYMFRADPMNSTALGFQLIAMAAQLQIPKLKAVYDISQEDLLPTYIIGEDLHWCDEMLEYLEEIADDLGMDIVGIGRPSAIETDFAPFFDKIEGSGAKLIVDIFSNPAGAAFIKEWGERKVKAVPVGINVESQMGEFYEAIDGKCEYETLMSALGTRTNIVPEAEPLNTVEFWDKYLAKYGHDPIYNSWGAYMELLYLNRTATQWIGKPCDEIVPIFEGHEEDTLLGYFKYTKYHELYCDEYSATPLWPSHGYTAHVPGILGTVRAHIPQWQAGKLEIVWPRGYSLVTMDPTPLPFARKWKIPPWVYSLAETDFAGADILLCPPENLAELAGIPAGLFGDFMLPDGTVGTHDMGAVTDNWQQTCAWTLLEADMDGNNFIDIDDVARVALDWGKSA